MPIDNITICGRRFSIPVPDRYVAGATIELTEGEARSFSQTFCETIRNNLSMRMKKLPEVDKVLPEHLVSEWQGKVIEYANAYQLGVRTRGVRVAGQVADPETREALSLIRPAIRKALIKKFGAKHGRTPDQVQEAAVRLLESDKGEKYRRMARQNLRQKEEATTEDLLDGLDMAAE